MNKKLREGRQEADKGQKKILERRIKRMKHRTEQERKGGIKGKRGRIVGQQEGGLKEGYISGSAAEVRTAEGTHSDI